MKYRAKKDIKYSELGGWDDYGTISKGTICESGIFNGYSAIFYGDNAVCDADSQRAKDCFEEVTE